MSIRPVRRWFQFSLSSYLILTAIIAWGLALWPWVMAVPVWPSYAVVIKPAALGPVCALLGFITWKLFRRSLASYQARRSNRSNNGKETMEQ